MVWQKISQIYIYFLDQPELLERREEEWRVRDGRKKVIACDRTARDKNIYSSILHAAGTSLVTTKIITCQVLVCREMCVDKNKIKIKNTKKNQKII